MRWEIGVLDVTPGNHFLKDLNNIFSSDQINFERSLNKGFYISNHDMILEGLLT